MSTTPDPQYVALLRRLRVEGGVDLREQLHARYLELGRGGTTPGGLPYPDPTDPVAEGADAIRALAEAVDGGWTPRLLLQRSAAQSIPAGAWTLLDATWGAPLLARQLDYTAGVATVRRTGWYRLHMHVGLSVTPPLVGAQVTRNSTAADTPASVLSAVGNNVQRVEGNVAAQFTAGDLVRALIFTQTAATVPDTPNAGAQLIMEWIS